MGKTKIFVKQPETVFALDTMKHEMINHYAQIIQKAWFRYIKKIAKTNIRQKRIQDLFFASYNII